jgi:HD superfamily phosphodiesterase
MAHQFIISAEGKHKRHLQEECKRLFAGVDIPSHDHNHHDRVWQNASLLLELLYGSSMISDPAMAEKALIASFFHDTGMTVYRGPDHGRESRRICDVYLGSCDLPDSIKTEILEAVEMHDNKDYTGLSDPSSLAAILSVADDMDAFGIAGIARYEEIYSMRGVPAEEMPGMIIKNVMSRLRHLETTYSMFPELIEDMREEAGKVINHFRVQTR